MKVGIVVASVRDKRKGLKVAKYVKHRAENLGLLYDLIDLKDFNLPHFNEPYSPSSGKEYKYQETRNWSDKVKQYDGFVFVTPEYNGYIPGSLKDAIDFLYNEWKEKAFGIFGYGGRGAKWASEGLEKLLNRFDMDFKGYVGLHKPWDAMDEYGAVDESYIDGDLDQLLHNFK